MAAYNIQNIPDDLPPGEYDVTLLSARFVSCRDGSTEIIFETEFRGPRNQDDPSLIHFTKE